MKNNIRTLLIICSGIIVFVLLMSPLKTLYWSSREFIQPNLIEDTKRQYRDKSSQFLVRVYKSSDAPLASAAASVLKGRKDPSVVNEMVAIIEKSRDQGLRSGAINILAKINDNNSLPLLIKIVQNGRKDPQYLYAMEALSEMHYNEIYSEILKLVADNYEITWVIDMIENFPMNPQTLPTLEKIAKDNPEWYIRDKVTHAIENIKRNKGDGSIYYF